jgi:hypothetical protein
MQYRLNNEPKNIEYRISKWLPLLVLGLIAAHNVLKTIDTNLYW